MATEAQIQANRQNAQKSSGPKTQEGKLASARNSLKHGLTGQAIIQPEGTEAELLQLRVQQWTDHLNPQSPTEEWLITSAAIASARIDRCIRYETATLDHRLRHLPATRQKQQAQALEALIEELNNKPEKAQPALLQSASGTRHLLLRWQSLHQSIANIDQSPATPSYLLKELGQLLGQRSSSFWKGRELHDLARLLLASFPESRLIPPLIAEVFGGAPPTEAQRATLRADHNLPPRESAQRALLAFIDSRIKHKQAHLEPLEAIEAQDEAQAADLALVDNSPEAARLHRYEAALFRQLNQCFLRLERLRETQPPANAGVTTQPEPHTPPQPASPASSPPPRQNEPNFPPARPDRTTAAFLDFTVGIPPTCPSRHPRHPRRARA